jgi:hypothetical protein
MELRAEDKVELDEAISRALRSNSKPLTTSTAGLSFGAPTAVGTPLQLQLFGRSNKVC